MATQEQVQSISVEAAADLSAAQFTFCVIDSNGQLAQVSSAGGDADGVLQNAPAAQGRAAALAYAGKVKVVAGATVAAGAKVQSDASGRAIAAASGDHVLGKALTAAASAGNLIEVLLVSKHILA